MFNDTSRYLDDALIIDNPEFDKHIPDIYRNELHLDKANTAEKEICFQHLKIRVIRSVYHKRDDLDRFPIVNFPWLSGDFPRLPS